MNQPSRKTSYPPLNADIPKIGYVIAVKKSPKGDKLGNVIEARQLLAKYPASACEYTHVEISLGGYRSMRIAPPRSKAINIDEFYQGRYIKILRYKDIDFEEKLRYKIAIEYALLCNRKYDKFGILSFIWSYIKHDPNLYFCSEGVCTAYQHYFKYAFGVVPDKCYPATIVSNEKMETVWEGYVPKKQKEKK